VPSDVRFRRSGRDTAFAINLYRLFATDLIAAILLVLVCRSCRPWRWFGWSASATESWKNSRDSGGRLKLSLRAGPLEEAL
jgi:hypothetical protein